MGGARFRSIGDRTRSGALRRHSTDPREAAARPGTRRIPCSELFDPGPCSVERRRRRLADACRTRRSSIAATTSAIPARSDAAAILSTERSVASGQPTRVDRRSSNRLRAVTTGRLAPCERAACRRGDARRPAGPRCQPHHGLSGSQPATRYFRSGTRPARPRSRTTLAWSRSSTSESSSSCPTRNVTTQSSQASVDCIEQSSHEIERACSGSVSSTAIGSTAPHRPRAPDRPGTASTL